ncbi:MAG: type II toxin-antitoxin system prevent-host-death family antitoxin [Clostridiales Family XIII bacterium]|jgi:antitoxin YefM|nr:type II toxin-antitoxin system prevent-host-death family antitoxin [Clostridiales Family XIII bacterium]
MLATNYTNVRQNLARYCNEAARNYETVVITRKNDENVVLISEAEYNNLMENLFIRRDALEYQALVDDIQALKSGKMNTVKKTLEELGAAE